MTAPTGRVASASVTVSGNIGPRLPERGSDVLDDKRQDEEVERVERPAQEAREHRIALIHALFARGHVGRQRRGSGHEIGSHMILGD